jgi:hypothetical protein
MSTIAIIIFVAIGLVIMMHLNDQTRDELSPTEENTTPHLTEIHRSLAI